METIAAKTSFANGFARATMAGEHLSRNTRLPPAGRPVATNGCRYRRRTKQRGRPCRPPRPRPQCASGLRSRVRDDLGPHSLVQCRPIAPVSWSSLPGHPSEQAASNQTTSRRHPAATEHADKVRRTIARYVRHPQLCRVLRSPNPPSFVPNRATASRQHASPFASVPRGSSGHARCTFGRHDG